MNLTLDQILALAPDASSAKAGQSLANLRHWSNLGRTEHAVWGACKGSGKEPYQTQIDLREPAFRCSCPSRKFPCKHGLGLLLLLATQPAMLPEADLPAHVAAWLAARDQQSQRRAAPPEPADDAAATQRRTRSTTQRETNVAAGIDELERWLRDQVRSGFATLQTRSPTAFDTLAARMVDAQAPGLARRLRQAGSIPASGAGWQGRLLEHCAQLYLLLMAYRRLATLDPALQADVRNAIGFTQNQEALLAEAGVRDTWAILGQTIEDDERVRTQRTWLIGLTSAQPALVLHFSVGAQPFDTSLVPGLLMDAELVFFPSATPLRALVRQRFASPTAITQLPQHDIYAATAAYAAALAQNPWLERYPLVIGSAGLGQRNTTDSRQLLVDATGRSLPITAQFRGAWELLARSGGQPCTITGIWDGAQFMPLGALIDGTYAVLEARA